MNRNPEAGEIVELLLPILLLAGMWALLIRPQQKRMKEHQALIERAAAGDRVLLVSGVYGTITEVLDVAMYVEIADGIEILVSRSQVQEILEEFPTEATSSTADEAS